MAAIGPSTRALGLALVALLAPGGCVTGALLEAVEDRVETRAAFATARPERLVRAARDRDGALHLLVIYRRDDGERETVHVAERSRGPGWPATRPGCALPRLAPTERPWPDEGVLVEGLTIERPGVLFAAGGGEERRPIGRLAEVKRWRAAEVRPARLAAVLLALPFTLSLDAALLPVGVLGALQPEADGPFPPPGRWDEEAQRRPSRARRPNTVAP